MILSSSSLSLYFILLIILSLLFTLFPLLPFQSMGPSTPESLPGPDSRNMGIATPSEKYTYVQLYRQIRILTAIFLIYSVLVSDVML